MIRKRNIVLVGSMGSGKSHFGRNLAEAKGWQFVDTDRVLEKQYKMPIANIYESIGEKAFHRAEMEILKRVSKYHEAVISVGGNFPLDLKTLRELKKYSFIIGIKAAEFRIVNRVNRRIGKRPTMDYTNVTSYVACMLQTWKPVYKKCDYVLDTTNGRTNDLMELIEEVLQKKHIVFLQRKRIEVDGKASMPRENKVTNHTFTQRLATQASKEAHNHDEHRHINQRRRRSRYERRHSRRHKGRHS